MPPESPPTCRIERRFVSSDQARTELRGSKEQDKLPTVVGHAAVFNKLSVDLGGFVERIRPGAFASAIERDDVRALVDHDPSRIIGRNRAGTLRMAEDDEGLAVEIDPADTTVGRDAVESLRRGDVDGMSFAFRVLPDGETWSIENGTYVRELTNVALYDVSVVTYPAYPDTDVAARSLRLDADTRRSFEQFRASNPLPTPRLDAAYALLSELGLGV